MDGWKKLVAEKNYRNSFECEAGFNLLWKGRRMFYGHFQLFGGL